MPCYLLTWNPVRWPWISLEADLSAAATGQRPEHRWSTGNTRRIAPGDRLFLLKQGDEPRGLMGSGFAFSAVTEEPHWDHARRAGGDLAFYVRLQFDRLLPPASVLPLDRLASGALAGMTWTPAAGGFQVPEALVSELEARWAEHVPGRELGAAPEELTPGAPYVEGALRTVLVNRYERDPRARAQCIKVHGSVCVVCHFSFRDVYGPLGEGYIHVHHLHPLHRAGGQRDFDPIEDLRPVCPNCHAMLHRSEPPLTLQQLQEQVHSAALQVKGESGAQ